MKDSNKGIYLVLIVLVIVIGVLAAMLIIQNKKINDLEINNSGVGNGTEVENNSGVGNGTEVENNSGVGNGTEVENNSGVGSGTEIENNFEVKTYYATKNSYIKLLDKDNYEFVSKDNKKVTGKYNENSKEIKLDSVVAYKKGDYLLVKDSDRNGTYTMFYDGKKYNSFINDIKSSNIYDYVTQDSSAESKKQITKVEIDNVSECFKDSLDEESFSCSIDYKYYIKDYKAENCSDYESNELYINIFAGSSITCEEDHIAKWSFFEFEKSGNKYKITNSFTGL